MNKKLWILVGLLTLLPFSVRANVLKSVVKVVWDVAPKVQVESPLLKQFGVSFRGEKMIITNGMKSFYAELYVYDRLIGTLGPGDVVYDSRHFEPLFPQVPFAARIYSSYDGKNLSGYVGMAMQLLTIGTSGRGSSVSWIIRDSDIRRPDGSYGVSRDAYPAVAGDVRPASEKKGFPREWWNSTASVQIGQNTNFHAVMRLDGKDRAELDTGDLYFLSLKEIGFDGQPATIQFIFTDRGQLVGTWEAQIFVPAQGLPSYQFIVGPYDIRKY
ncbi:MAG: hypothetical protein HYT13_00595 [Candidatus Liptonbacteria bacterium]|nr:hypothetical protein [Candidatus Liptonbacteria bacterium]